MVQPDFLFPEIDKIMNRNADSKARNGNGLEMKYGVI
jgi:hypothetical protein